MTLTTFIVKNAFRNKRRALLSVSSVAVSLFLLVTLQVALRELTLPVESPGAELRVCARNKVSLTNPLPARQRPIIEKIPGVEGVTPFTWFGGQYQNEGAMTFAQFAMDPKETRTVFTDFKLTDAELARFQSEKTAAIIGKITADKYHF
jgi:putative ABC transport system permease protein